MKDNMTYLGAVHSRSIEDLYRQYRQDPESVDYGWRKFFEGFDFAQSDYETGTTEAIPDHIHKEFRVINLIDGYRRRGHLFTKTNPVRARRTYRPTLDIENFGLTKEDLDTSFRAGELIGIGPATLRDIVAHLQRMYCQSIGVEYMYIRDPERVRWIQERIEVKEDPRLSADTRLALHELLTKTVVFEQFLQKKFVGQKRFSIEGGESLIPALERLVRNGIRSGTKEVVLGMAHRGRLNALAHIMGKEYTQIFNEFRGKAFEGAEDFDGDVKYHLGFSKKVTTADGKPVRVTLCPNPSHLESVDPVAEGLSRAKLDHKLEKPEEIMPVIIHGDAAIAGQGVIYEVVQMAGLDGYFTGGTIHIVVNNQVGFTTNYLDARTSTYCTDVGKVTLCPVFHVNADDLDAVIRAIDLAVAYRQQFHRDIFIDLLGYRKYGHNEGDEPKFTQPKLYKIIARHPNLLTIYTEKLIRDGLLTEAEAQRKIKDFEATLEAAFEASKASAKVPIENFMHEAWKGFKKPTLRDFEKKIKTGVPKRQLLSYARKIFTLPDGINFFRKARKLMADRLAMVESGRVDWAIAETLAYSSLLAEGHPVRLSGQDVERGTFAHRHAVLKAEDTEEEYIPLQHLAADQAAFYVYNSPLSEYGVLGFEYGYAFGVPHGLTIWEAQFGDFFNGAQIILDQYLSAAADKWNAYNGLVLYLPHGYEGMGSEHSSARIERFLQLCAEENMQVCNPTTPANFFHLLRLHIHRPFRVPLVIFTPKKLLRYPRAVSGTDELSKGHFRPVIDDPAVKAKDVDTVLFCSGKVYYDLVEARETRKEGYNMAFVRLEQLYPLPRKELAAIVKKYHKAQFIWVQEEPRNMGAWSYFCLHYDLTPVTAITRPDSGSPASGSYEVHLKRTQKLLESVFAYAK